MRATGARPAAVAAARLVAIGLVFALAVLVQVGGREQYSERQLTALYALVLAGFLVTLGQALVAASGGGRRFAAVELFADGLLVSGLVYATGGPRSLFSFLYLAWIVQAALRAGSLGASLSALGATGGYALVAVALARGWLPWLDPEAAPALQESATALATHVLAFALVALLSHRLVRQIQKGERELHELGEIHRRIFENVSSGLLTVNAAGRITSFNREAERISGFARSAVVGRPLCELFPEIATALASPPPPGDAVSTRLQLVLRGRAGTELHLGLSRSTLRDARGDPDGSVVIFQDLTRLVEIERELHRSERLAAVGQLAAGLAHEIRNPLAAISGAVELLAGGLPDLGPDPRRLWRIVRRETTRLDRLVVDFLAYARPGRLRSERCVVAEVLGEIAELLAGSDARGATLELDLAPGLEVAGDPDALRQVLWNLVRNASEAGPPGASVRVTGTLDADAREPGAGRVRIEVIDRGAGMPPELLDRLFEPFFTTKPKGTGLGLATVHRLVERQGGSVAVHSELGVGTRVAILLPSTS